jgi:hypothetical protein
MERFFYRVSGIPFNFALELGAEDKKQTILDDFKALKLVCWDAATQTIVYETWETKFDTPLDVYTQLIPSKKRPRSAGPVRSDRKMDMLLERLRLSGSAEHVFQYSKH